MDVGIIFPFQSSANQPMSDLEVYQNEVAIAELAEPLGFNSLWAPEHHFTNYSMSPNPIQFLTYMAGKTKTIKLGTAAIILPWHKDPIRIATDLSLLDNLSNGRVIIGFGRGIGRVEYDGFGIEMDSSRSCFNEAAEMVLDALDSGTMDAHNGSYFNQISRDIRPAPFKSFKDRTYIVSMSPDTVPHAARLGGTMMTFAIGPWKQRAKDIVKYRELFMQEHGRSAPPTSANIFTICDNDPGRAKDMAHKYMADYWESAMNHYEMKGEHFDGVKDYEYYGRSAVAMREDAKRVTEQYVEQQIYGTPDQILERIKGIEDIIGPFELNSFFSFAGMDYGYVKNSVTLFAEKVLPVLNKWDSASAAAE